jgi:hypothetical protein
VLLVEVHLALMGLQRIQDRTVRRVPLAQLVDQGLQRDVVLRPPELPRHGEVPEHFVAGPANQRQVLRNGADVPAAAAPVIGDLCGRVRLQPSHLVNDQASSRRQKPSPGLEARFEPHGMEGSLGPDDVERRLREVHCRHGAVNGVDAIGESLPCSPLDERG